MTPEQQPEPETMREFRAIESELKRLLEREDGLTISRSYFRDGFWRMRVEGDPGHRVLDRSFIEIAVSGYEPILMNLDDRYVCLNFVDGPLSDQNEMVALLVNLGIKYLSGGGQLRRKKTWRGNEKTRFEIAHDDGEIYIFECRSARWAGR